MSIPDLIVIYLGGPDEDPLDEIPNEGLDLNELAREAAMDAHEFDPTDG